jgi:hypothetical protein
MSNANFVPKWAGTVLNGGINKYFLSLLCGSIIGIETGYGLDDREVVVRVPVGSRIHIFQTRSGVQPTSYSMCTGVKRQGHEADRSPLIIAEVKKTGISISTLPPPSVFMAYCLISSVQG